MNGVLIPSKSIAIVGGGLGALAVADALGDVARDAVLLTAELAPQAKDSLGVARCGPAMHPVRLAAGHGMDVVSQLLDACRDNANWLRDLDAQHPDIGLQAMPSYRCTEDTAEWDEMLRSQPLWQRAAIAVTKVEPPSFHHTARPRFRRAMRHHEDSVVNPTALVQALRSRAESRGLTLRTETQVNEVTEEGGVVIATSHGPVRAEIAIVATEAQLPALVPFCRFKIVPMRVQALAAACTGVLRPGIWSAAYGYEVGRVNAGGDVWVSGHRDLPVRDELGARREPSAAVQKLLEGELRNWEAFTAHRVVRRWAGTQAVSCDGLPLAGPVPGRPRILVLGGFGMDGLGVTLAAARVVAELVRTGRATHAAAFAPRRFT